MIGRRGLIVGTVAGAILEGTAMSVGLGAPMGDVEFDEGIPGRLGAASIGIMGIAENARHARVSLGWQAGAIGWTTSLDVQVDGLVPTPGLVFRVKAIVAGRERLPAKVVFTPDPDAHHVAAQAGAILLVEGDGSRGGGLRFGASDHTSSMIATRWEPNVAAPSSVAIAWWPGIDVHDYADPATIHSMTVTRDSTISVPDGRLSVLAIEGHSVLHPGWVVLSVG